MAKSELKVRQVRSHITSKQEHVATLRALGLGKINSCTRVPDNEAVRGMLSAVRHLVEVTPVE
ncbi:MAG: 50S ribosomal protein L30 [candidate division WS1 bacterium]|jgi:large subunit ribosomal protein L30|nr:50S ribosomal protein L30 [candidate division WS1 bacterium]